MACATLVLLTQAWSNIQREGGRFSLTSVELQTRGICLGRNIHTYKVSCVPLILSLSVCVCACGRVCVGGCVETGV